MSARSLAEWLVYQQHEHGRAIDLGLPRVREVAQRLGLLTAPGPVITVGGTNGKGSTATIAAAVLQVLGRRVGLFTSPHLLHYNERVRIDGVAVDDAALVAAFERIEAARGDISLTFFEYNTLAALDVFRSRTDVMVLEVGLGGRLDATNIVDADVAVVCSVGFDHRDWLGDTLEAIGAEKAGIFRPGRPVVLGSRHMPATVWQRARALQCPVRVAERDFAWRIGGDGRWDFIDAEAVGLTGPGMTLKGLPAPALAGAIQYGNAATALAALAALGVGLAAEAQRVGQALRALQLAGRLQVIPGEVEWLLDVAHNPPAAAVLAAELRRRPVHGRTIAVAGMLADKDAATVAHTLDGVIDHWVLCDTRDDLRALAAVDLRTRLGALRGTSECVSDVAAACAGAAALAQRGDRVLVFGSFHVVGPALQWLGYT
jgi:dihydrofolate synthase/folylpolyglutamate synthase